MKISSVFSNHMVLQRDQLVPIWGWAKPNEKITIKYSPSKGCKNKSQIKKTVTAKDGKWIIELDNLQASKLAAKLTAESSGGISLMADDILVGDVWLASGQSNMEWIVENSLNAEKEIASAKWPQIRMFTVPRITADNPVDNVNADWLVCSPEKVAPLDSAVAYPYTFQYT